MATSNAQSAATASGTGRQVDELAADGDRHMRQLFDAAPIPLFQFDSQHITVFNQCFGAIFGYTAGERPALRDWWERACPDPVDRNQARECWRIAIEQAGAGDGTISPFEFHVQLKGDEERTLLASCRQLDHSMLGVLVDVTAERAAARVMREATALAENAAQTKSKFLANMSHEIRTPMNAIIGMAHLALRTELTARQRNYVEKIWASSQHLLEVINDILDVSKFEAGKTVLERIPFDLEETVSYVAGLIADKAASKGLELIIDIADGVPTDLVGDPLRITQVLLNFANNAVKFTDRGQIVVRVSVEFATDNEALLRFSVHDTGIGLSAEECSRLFRSFEQADGSITRKYGGTGLGLAIAKGLAEAMGGAVGVQSEPARGSNFWFTVRLGLSQGGMRQASPSPELLGRRVLVLEDNADVRSAIVHMLRSMSLVVGEAITGPQGLAEIARAATAGEAYEGVLVGSRVPKMEGVAVAQRIRHLAAAPPVLLLVSGTLELHLADEEPRVQQLLAKPVTRAPLVKAVSSLLGAGQAPAGAATAQPQCDLLSSIAGLRVLLVEDNELNQEVAVELLARAGVAVDVAADGAAALEMVRSCAYALVLMDIQMPVMDGISSTREIRKLFNRAELPIVALTGSIADGMREDCFEAGMNDCLDKPIDPKRLSAVLLQWIKPRTGTTLQVGPGPRSSSAPVGVPTTRISPLASVPGLDFADGLRRLRGREELYLSMLGKFAASERDFVSRMEAALAQPDWQGAERVAHNLKGALAVIGAPQLRAMVQRLEQAVRDREPLLALKPLLAEVSHSLGALLDALVPHLPGEPFPPVDGATPADQA